MKIVKCSEKSIRAAVRLLKAGQCVVYPTDTVYGLAVDAANYAAVRKLYRLKGRNFNKPVHIAVGSLAQAKGLARFDARAERLFRKFLPGALTLVLGQKPEAGGRKPLRVLSADTGTLGIRMPKNRVALSLVRKLGRPITATSANVSGKPACYSAAEVVRQFERRKLQPDLILDAGGLPWVKPSTVVDLAGQSVRILRQGPVSRKQISDICAGKR